MFTQFQSVETQVPRPHSPIGGRPVSPDQDHWFDRLTRGLAQGGVSRRRLLIGSMAAGWASGLGMMRPSLALGQPAPTQPPQPPQPIPPVHPVPPIPQAGEIATCTIATEAQNQVLSVVAQRSLGTKLVAYTSQTTIAQSGTITIHQVIAYEGATVFELNLQRQAGGAAEVSVEYGTVVSGARQLVFSSSDGKTLNGELDGRAIVPFPIGASAGALRFLDGQPAPNVTATPAIRQAVAIILQQAKTATANCQRTVTRVRSPENAPANTGQSDDTFDTPQCAGCLGGCAATAAGIGAGCCVATLGIGCGICVGGAAIGVAACIATCHFTVCCPVHCGSQACCFAADSCLDPTRGVCCQAGTLPCHNRECCQASDSCLPNGTCCPSGQAVCDNNICCQPGQACSTEGICCQQLQPGAPPISCRGVCCAAGDVCLDGVACCPPNQPVCNGVCCLGGRCDANGNCCGPPSKFCGGSNICCPPFNLCCGDECCNFNQSCTNGTCTNTVCPSGQVPCEFTPGMCCPPGLMCCPATNTCCDTTTTICCQEKGCIAPGACFQ